MGYDYKFVFCRQKVMFRLHVCRQEVGLWIHICIVCRQGEVGLWLHVWLYRERPRHEMCPWSGPQVNLQLTHSVSDPYFLWDWFRIHLKPYLLSGVLSFSSRFEIRTIGRQYTAPDCQKWIFPHIVAISAIWPVPHSLWGKYNRTASFIWAAVFWHIFLFLS